MPAHDDENLTNARPVRGAEDLAAQVVYLEEEIAVLRRRLREESVGLPRSARAVDERITNLQATVAGLNAQNERLVSTLREAREQFERAYLQQQLLLCSGKVGQLAKRVGMERTHLYRKLRSLGVDFRNISDD